MVHFTHEKIIRIEMQHYLAHLKRYCEKKFNLNSSLIT